MKNLVIIMVCLFPMAISTSSEAGRKAPGSDSATEKVEKAKGEEARKATAMSEKTTEESEEKRRTRPSNTSPANPSASVKELEEQLGMITNAMDDFSNRLSAVEGGEENEQVKALKLQLDELKSMAKGITITTENLSVEIKKTDFVVKELPTIIDKQVKEALENQGLSGWTIFFRLLALLTFILLVINFSLDYARKKFDEKVAKKMKEAGFDPSDPA